MKLQSTYRFRMYRVSGLFKNRKMNEQEKFENQLAEIWSEINLIQCYLKTNSITIKLVPNKIKPYLRIGFSIKTGYLRLWRQGRRLKQLIKIIKTITKMIPLNWSIGEYPVNNWNTCSVYDRNAVYDWLLLQSLIFLEMNLQCYLYWKQKVLSK